MRFPGQYYDSETGLHYNYYRDYDPSTGRYVQSDPIGLEGGFNTYLYAGANPFGNIDPEGLAYFAKRPLEGFSWYGKWSCNPGSTLDRRNMEISHEQLFFEDGKSPSNLGFFNTGQVDKDDPKFEPSYRCKSGQYNDCIMREAVKNVPGGDYCLLGKRGVRQNNCQNWAERVRREYKRLASDPAIMKKCNICPINP